MRALVTGGAGFIGSNLVENLLASGHEVSILDNLTSGYKSNVDLFPSARFVQGDIRDRNALTTAAKGSEVIFHLAASVGNNRSIQDPYLDAEVNVLGTINVLQAARACGARKVVFSSSAGIFGELKTLPIREDHACEPDSPYGSSKLGAEKECLAFAKLFGLEVVCLRYFNVYGKRQRFDAYGNAIPIFAFQMLRNERVTIFGDGEQTRDFVEVRDVVQANVKAAAATGVSGAFNIASASRITINRLVSMLAEITKSKSEVTHSAPRPGDVRHSLADITAAHKSLGFVPSVSLEEGLRGYCEWAKDEVRAQAAAAQKI